MRPDADILRDVPDRLRDLVEAWLVGVRASDGRPLVRDTLADLSFDQPVLVIAAGKAAVGMAWGADDALGTLIDRGIVVADTYGDVPDWAKLHIGSHPIPNERSLEAGAAAMELARLAQPGQPVLTLISGGGSALLEVLKPGFDLADLEAISNMLLTSGAPIAAINTARTRLSAIKGGGLARASAGALTTLVLSDVAGDPGAVASGPTIAWPPYAAEWEPQHYLDGPITEATRQALAVTTHAAPVDGEVIVVGDGRTAGDAIVAHFEAVGAEVAYVSDTLTGPVDIALPNALDAVAYGTVGVFTGEPTISVPGGSGGRSQHAAAMAALELTGTSDRFLAAGTDGIDGPTDVAGGVVDGATLTDEAQARDLLRSFSSQLFLDLSGGSIRSGRTGTNVADVWIVDRRGDPRVGAPHLS